MDAMRRGDFAAAWAVSDRVLQARDPAGRDDPALPYHLRWVWDGRPFEGQPVLVRCYHGLGDTLQFCRFLPLLRRRAARVTLEVQPALLPLLSGLADRLIPFDPARPSPSAACEVEIMELSHALRAVPEPGPYLRVPPLPRLGDGLAVGVCWQSGAGWDAARSLPLSALVALGSLPGVQLVSLQRGPALAELGRPGAPPMLDEREMDIGHTARRIASLDLVVTTDTMVAHLAGALGRPAWVLLKHEADWRWLGAGPRTPWYGAARLYRQEAPGVWDAPVGRLVADLAALVQRGGEAGGTPAGGGGLLD